MSKLLSCFWQSKNESNFSPQNTGKKRRGQYKKNSEKVYRLEETDSPYTVLNSKKHSVNQHRVSDNVSSVYRTETYQQNSQYEKLFKQDTNRQSKSYPASPEQRFLSKVYSFEDGPTFGGRRMSSITRESIEPKKIMSHAANVVCIVKTSDDSLPYGTIMENIPRRSTVSPDYDLDFLIAKGSINSAEKPAEGYHLDRSTENKPDLILFGVNDDKNIEESEGQSSLGMPKINSKNKSPTRFSLGNQNAVHLVSENIGTQSKPKTRARSLGSKTFSLGNTVKPMIYRAEDVEHSPMSAHRRVCQMPMKPLPVRAMKPPPLLATEDGAILRRLSSESEKRLSTTSRRGNPPSTISTFGPTEIEEFPLGHGAETVVAAPMIGGDRSGRRMSRNYFGPSSYFPEVYSYTTYHETSRGYFGEDMGGYGHRSKCKGCSRGNRSDRQIYAAQMPNTVLPTTLFGQGKNTIHVNASKHSNTPETLVKIHPSNLQSENIENNTDCVHKGSRIKCVSSSQQTDPEKELDFVCFSPDRFFTAVEGSQDPKLKWRIVIKRGDEESHEEKGG